jgi:hypothetical protein
LQIRYERGRGLIKPAQRPVRAGGEDAAPSQTSENGLYGTQWQWNSSNAAPAAKTGRNPLVLPENSGPAIRECALGIGRRNFSPEFGTTLSSILRIYAAMARAALIVEPVFGARGLVPAQR